jgi:hypothetical protein
MNDPRKCLLSSLSRKLSAFLLAKRTCALCRKLINRTANILCLQRFGAANANADDILTTYKSSLRHSDRPSLSNTPLFIALFALGLRRDSEMATSSPIGVSTPANLNAAAVAAQQTAHADDSSSTSGTLKEQTPLNEISVACLIINKMIGTGIYTTPGIVLLLCGNKVLALFLWIFGGVYSYLRSEIFSFSILTRLTRDCSIYIYLEYGLAWPYNGGEFFYVCPQCPQRHQLQYQIFD